MYAPHEEREQQDAINKLRDTKFIAPGCKYVCSGLDRMPELLAESAGAIATNDLRVSTSDVSTMRLGMAATSGRTTRCTRIIPSAPRF